MHYTNDSLVPTETLTPIPSTPSRDGECQTGEQHRHETKRKRGAQPRTEPSTSSRGLFLLEELRNQPPPQWIIRGIIPEGAVGFVIGAANVGKTALTICLALTVARGEDFYGHPTQARPVIYIPTDDPYFTPLRMRAWSELTGKRPEERVALWTKPVDLTEPGDVKALISEAEEMGFEQPLWVVDTRSASMSGSPNDPEKMIAFMRGCRALVTAFPGSAVVVLAHPGWNNQERISGSYEQQGQGDFVLFVKASERHSEHVEVSSGKMRNAPQLQTFYARLKPVRFNVPGYEEYGEQSAIVAVPDDGSEPEQKTHEDYAKQHEARGKGEPSRHRKAHALKVLRDAGRTGLGLNEWERKSGIPKATLRGWAKAWMANDGCPVAQRDGRYIAAEFARDGD